MERKEMIAEAIERMKMIGLNKDAIKDFKENGKAWKSETPMGILYWLDEKEEEMVKAFEERTGAIAYHLIKNNLEFGTCYSILYVSKNKEEWKLDRQDLVNYCPLVYVENIDDEYCSEYGYIGIRPIHSGLVREC